MKKDRGQWIEQRPRMPISFHVTKDGFDGRTAAQFALDDPEDAALLTGDEDAVRIGGAAAAVALVDSRSHRSRNPTLRGICPPPVPVVIQRGNGALQTLPHRGFSSSIL